jgi:type I restriction enzyme S subunit
MEKLKNIPSLRFPEFNGEWENSRLGEVMNFKVTNSFSRDNLNYENGKVKNIHYGDIHTKFQTLFDITRESVPFINEEVSIGRISDDFYCKEGDIIFADASEDINDVGKSIEIINLNNEKLLSGLHTLLARPIENTFEIGFNGYLFKSNTVRTQIQKESQGSKVLSINVGRISGIEITFPILKEQQKIASFLLTVDDKLQTLKQKKTLLDQYKKGVIQKIFSREIRFKDDYGNDYPDWEDKKLGEVSRITTGSSNREDSNLDGEFTFFDRSQDIRSSNRFLFDAEAIIVPGEGQEFIPKYFIGKFDLHQRTYAIMDFVPNNGKFLFYYISFNSNHLNSHAVGSTVKSLRLPMFEKMPIKLPSQEEQSKISNFLSAIDEKIEYCQLQIANTEVWKKGLLQQMFC